MSNAIWSMHLVRGIKALGPVEGEWAFPGHLQGKGRPTRARRGHAVLSWRGPMSPWGSSERFESDEGTGGRALESVRSPCSRAFRGAFARQSGRGVRSGKRSPR